MRRTRLQKYYTGFSYRKLYLSVCGCGDSHTTLSVAKEHHASKDHWQLKRRTTRGSSGRNRLRGSIRYRVSKQWEGKAYVLLYACSLTRGIYLDLLPNLETEECLKSLKQFIGRRGQPERIHSDNSRTFTGTANWIRAVMKDQWLQTYLSINQIKWQLNLSRTLWWGGQFERLIGLVKSALNKTIGNGLLWWKELQEVLLDVEITLNNRPLSYVEDDVQMPLMTLNAMLFLDSNLLPELLPHHIETADLRKRAKHLLKCKEAVWSRWTNEYQRSLRKRHRAQWGAGGDTPAVGDIVIIKTEDKNRGKWPLGIIENLTIGNDGVVRGAKLTVLNIFQLFTRITTN